ncbi:2-ketogluconate transporter [Burkholderia ubonensis]|uniref:2-ketogluconate transporter n=1 Tax=Burkholderia ubonensis TaxID=101571 RepID=A0ABD6Q2K2_9BURK|nr:MFS transporter [Burkholderia ubonensis]KVH69954.1 2-ketogluconate transporter [Burkholderia ubonensis]KVM86419.1 2-ketogluconate transporter [Burkholderia ubonensis]KVO20798.1 2-ketogluconate transporter [Burkholderia ubonensis]KVO86461.1 2-ketogluconate transporter [Burkholderia ubonensis]KVP58850.1 2-ketogluconate transporter [Burkholderia ubonensis]
MTTLNQASPAYDADVAAPVPRRRWLRVIPPLLMACIISYMDRVNIAFAMPGGMNADLGIGASMAGLAGGIFFFGYLFLQIPGGRLAALGGGKKFIAWSLVSWAVLSALTGLVTEAWQLLALRFLLGVAEGGMLPVVLTMVSNWFPDRERGRANAMVIMFVPLAGMITAPLSGYILATYDWRHLFYGAGLLSLAFLAIWLPFADDSPETARWISPREKAYIAEALAAEREAARVSEQKTAASFGALLRDGTIWRLVLINFCYQVGIYGYTLWLPTLLKNLTHGGMAQVGMLAILPYVGTMLGMSATSYLSDKTGRRRLFIVLPLLGFAACLFLSVRFQATMAVSYAFLIGCGFFLQAAAGVFWAIPPKLCSVETAGSARGLINALGNLGGFCGPYAVGVLTQHVSTAAGVYSLAGALAVAGLLTFTLPKRCEA